MSASAPYPEFWVRKMRSFFVKFDHDLDGVVKKEDVMDFCNVRAKSLLNQEQMETYMDQVNYAWDYFWAGPEKKMSVTFWDFVRNHARNFREPDFQEEEKMWFCVYFDKIADKNGDGIVTRKEYEEFLGLVGVHPLSVPPSFDALDTDGDGQISKEEFVNAAVGFFCCTADTPAKKEYEEFLGLVGVHPLSVPPSFDALDTDGDGQISKEEFANAAVGFFCCTADTPAKLFWGPFLA
ncbi:sarcoplasmic calcium-binding protein-like [Lingula anatina]|uniref:Sarcoplasmic calcium-binding protein-like n=1 Tax=Lingula anatina TaxID=7574 RepID=A0A1S3JI26_LINAN|nr:sarcoplasmic calcium-binding protein-like [Lingula anatina]|eukprot:XP_013410042.1 sarcoplasmic calcium-binding protein-like [Lingula anatina]